MRTIFKEINEDNFIVFKDIPEDHLDRHFNSPCVEYHNEHLGHIWIMSNNSKINLDKIRRGEEYIPFSGEYADPPTGDDWVSERFKLKDHLLELNPKNKEIVLEIVRSFNKNQRRLRESQKKTESIIGTI